MDKNKVPYFNSAYEWVKSLPYEQPLYEYKGQDCGGYVYHNPFESRWGKYPTEVYDNLFGKSKYYIVSDEELTELRTTIQYLPIYLDDSFEKISEFLIKQGFKRYIKQGKRGDLVNAYFKRNNISLYLSNLVCPQDFVPNTIEVEISELIKSPKTGKTKRVQRKSFAHIPVYDELGEKTVESFEAYLKKYIIEKDSDNENDFETLGAHIRNMLSPYANIVQILYDINSAKTDEKTKKLLKRFLLSKTHSENLKENLQHLIDISNMKEVEKINWRATDLYNKYTEKEDKK